MAFFLNLKNKSKALSVVKKYEDIGVKLEEMDGKEVTELAFKYLAEKDVVKALELLGYNYVANPCEITYNNRLAIDSYIKYYGGLVTNNPLSFDAESIEGLNVNESVSRDCAKKLEDIIYSKEIEDEEGNKIEVKKYKEMYLSLIQLKTENLVYNYSSVMSFIEDIPDEFRTPVTDYIYGLANYYAGTFDVAKEFLENALKEVKDKDLFISSKVAFANMAKSEDDVEGVKKYVNEILNYGFDLSNYAANIYDILLSQESYDKIIKLFEKIDSDGNAFSPLDLYYYVFACYKTGKEKKAESFMEEHYIIDEYSPMKKYSDMLIDLAKDGEDLDDDQRPDIMVAYSQSFINL